MENLEIYLDYIGDDSYVYRYNYDSKKYYNTGICLKGNPGNPGRPGRNGDSWSLKDVDGTYYWFKNGANTGIPAQTNGGATPTNLARVAETGSYNDLTNKPTIPTVPTNVSAFTNDAGYITKTVDDLVNYYLKSEVYTKTEVTNLIAAIQQFHYEIYTSTSDVTSPQGNVLYLIGPTGTGSDKYEEYVYDSTKQEPWVKIGDTSIDLSGYVTTIALNTALAEYTTTTNLTKLLAGKQDTLVSGTNIKTINNESILGSGNITIQGGSGNVNSVNGKTGDVVLSAEDVDALPSNTPLFSGDYNDLSNKPTIPYALSQLSEDSTHRTVSDTEKTTWNNKSDFSGSYNDLTDKPTIPAEQVQSDWNQTNNNSKDFIKNKPAIPIVPTNVSAFNNDVGYITQHQDISGKEDVTTIVAPVNATDATLPITSLTCEVGKYYRLDVAVDTLAVTLPVMENVTSIKTVVIYLTGGTTPAVTILSTAPTGGNVPDVYYQEGYAIESGKTYEVNCLWNGDAWIVASVEIILT